MPSYSRHFDLKSQVEDCFLSLFVQSKKEMVPSHLPLSPKDVVGSDTSEADNSQVPVAPLRVSLGVLTTQSIPHQEPPGVPP